MFIIDYVHDTLLLRKMLCILSSENDFLERLETVDLLSVSAFQLASGTLSTLNCYFREVKKSMSVNFTK